MKKMFCIDIDGTLLKSNGEISNKTLYAIKLLKELGHKIVLCSARSRKSVINICKLVNSNNYIISSNGAEIYDYKNKQLILANYIDANICIELWNICNDSNFKISLAIDDKEYVNNKFWDNQIIIKQIDEINVNKIKSIMIVFDNYEDGLSLFNRIKTSDIVKSCWNKIESEKIGHWFNVLDINSSKGYAVSKLADVYSISKDNIISFGNDYNDISMFEKSGKGCAVSNSDEELIKVADTITRSNDEDGVANYIFDNYLNF